MSLLHGLIELTNIEDKQGRWRIILEYDNSGDCAMVKTGDGEIVGKSNKIPNWTDDPEVIVHLQFEEAIRRAVSWYVNKK